MMTRVPGWTRPGAFDPVAKGRFVSGFPKRLMSLCPTRSVVLASQIPKHPRDFSWLIDKLSP